MSGSDPLNPLTQVREEFAHGLDRRVAALRQALERLDAGFRGEEADALFRTAHALAGTAASFGAGQLAEAAGELERLANRWVAGGEAGPEERQSAQATLAKLEQAARAYQAALPPKAVTSAAARLAVVGELASLINARFDLQEIFQAAILKVRRVLDFRRASVVLVDASGMHYYLHTLYDNLRGGFVAVQAIFPIRQGLTGEALRSGQPIRVDSLPGTEGILAQQGRRVSVLIVPLKLSGQIIGTLNFGHEEPRYYTEGDLEWAVVLARQIETSLHYSKLLSAIAQQREELAGHKAALERERNQLEALVDASDAAIMLVGRDHRIAHANAEMARLVAIPREAVLGAPVEKIHRLLAASLADRAALDAQERALAGDEPLRDQVELAFPGRSVHQRVVAPVREPNGTLVGHIVLYRDVTREAEVERMKSEFVSLVSHELRTPMTSVKTSLSLLLRGAAGALDPAAKELLEIAVRNADRLIRLVNDLLDLSRIKAGRLELHPEPVSVADTVASSLETVRALAEEHGVRLETRAPPEALLVRGVPDRLVQVVVNLLANAIKFSPHGRRVAVRWWSEGAAAVLEVADEGPGIPAEQLQAIFEPFRQLDSSTTRAHGGAGLGLAISQSIVQALGGELWAQSEVGTGSRFFARLPLAPADWQSTARRETADRGRPEA